ncbi:hypothetical protein [Nitrosomonas halophila]|uniref:Uncharacterized protein n=1 Tax=Nitrosomonas halophila TaxID=44576 RepID=A0A1H3KM86_9PROT|nr:hypothetical protein [Nitrosomonas halophila]SDY53262.1 hypothetical protein SAMN05421881_104117 [Nitrosomonas halophila]
MSLGSTDTAEWQYFTQFGNHLIIGCPGTVFVNERLVQYLSFDCSQLQRKEQH